MFGLDALGLHQPSLNMSTIRSWASEVCSQHLKAGANPTDSLVKIARDNSLTPHQVEVLAGEINKTIHIAKYASIEDKYHAANFPLADSKAALSALQVTVQEEKVAFEIPEPKVGNQDVDWNALFGVSEAPQDKTASVRGQLKTAAERLELVKEKQDESAFMSKIAAADAELNYIKTARAHVLSGINQVERMAKIADVIHAAKCASLYEHARQPLAKLAHSLGREGLLNGIRTEATITYLLEKSADEKAPDELISEWIQAKVVNGDHPLVATLRTVATCKERAIEEASRASLIDDKLNVTKQTLRAL